MSPTVAAPPPLARIAWTRLRPLQGRALFSNQRPPQRAGSSPCVPAGPGQSALSQVRGRGGRCRPSPLATQTLIASAAPLTHRRHGPCRRRRPTFIRRPSRPSVLRVGPRVQRACIPVSGMTRLRIPARAASPRRVSGQAAWDDAPHRRRSSPSRTYSRAMAWASHLLLLKGADRGGSAAASTHLCEPSRPPPGRSAGDQSAPAPEGRLVGVRADGAGSVGSISVRGKRTATPMSARGVADSDSVDDALDLSPSTTQLSTAPTRSPRR